MLHTDDIPLQLLDECQMGHILNKKCVYVSPRPKDGTANRKSLKEETEALRHIPPRPPMDCYVRKGLHTLEFVFLRIFGIPMFQQSAFHSLITNR